MGRYENILVFQDTENLCKKVASLSDAIKKSTKGQLLILEDDSVENVMPELLKNRKRYEEPARLIVSKKRSYEAASAYKELKVCVHNFASATTPGGGVVKGSSAQEECLCRCSTLYFSLNTPQTWRSFYNPHRIMQNPVHNGDCIYTPGVVVMKSDTAEPKLLSEKEWYEVNVVTCAAPNLRLMPSNRMNACDGKKTVKMTDKELLRIHKKRMTRILDIAVAGGNEAIILGAFGCGAFKNSPEVVVRAAKDVIQKYMHNFKVIEFAIYCSERDEQNYTTFRRVLTNGNN